MKRKVSMTWMCVLDYTFWSNLWTVHEEDVLESLNCKWCEERFWVASTIVPKQVTEKLNFILKSHCFTLPQMASDKHFQVLPHSPIAEMPFCCLIWEWGNTWKRLPEAIWDSEF